MNFLIISIIYPIIYRPLWTLALITKSFFPKIDKGFKLRAAKNGVPAWNLHPKNTRPLWIHCQSGEFEYALPIIREIKRQKPETKILVTYYTPSYVERIHKEPLIDFATPLPWDTVKDVSEFLEHHNPQQLLISRTGLWPQVLNQCSKQNIPISLFATIFTKKIHFWNKWYFRWIFFPISHFYVVSQDDKENLLSVNSDFKITVSGDPRYEQCLYRLKTETLSKKIDPSVFHKKIFIAASTWPEDEVHLLPFIIKNISHYHWIMVPHESDRNHLANIQKKLTPIPFSFSTDIEKWDGTGVLVVNEFGLLSTLYKVADVAFIGGSFKSTVHSVMESLACGNITFVGPYHQNNREALDFKNYDKTTIAPVQVLNTADDFLKIIEKVTQWSKNDVELLIKEFTLRSDVSKNLVASLLK